MHILKSLGLLLAISLAHANEYSASLESRPDEAKRTVGNGMVITFIGPIEVGGHNVTLTGDAKSIYEQIMALNPKYDPMDFPVYRQRQAELQAEKALRLAKGDTFYCDVGNLIYDPNNSCRDGQTFLNRLNGDCYAPPGPDGCTRVTCSHQCGIYLCNDTPAILGVWCGNIAGDVTDIEKICNYYLSDGNLVGNGKVYRNKGSGWSTIISGESC